MNPSTHINYLRVGTVIIVSTFLFMGAKPALADPHALFYTSVGQQQLFFNMLAALDQADYVEPATTLPGAENTTSRAGLLEQRTGAGFGPEEDERVQATATNLSSLLTRSITLEGQDLWTAYLAHQFAIEAARRNGSDELIRVFCERGLGIKDCDDSVEHTADYEKERKQAFEVDPVESASDTALRGLAVLFSGTPGTQEEARHILAGSTAQSAGNKDFLDEGPYAYDPNIAEYWQKAQEGNQASRKTELATATAIKASQQFFPSSVDPLIWDYVDFSENGVPLYNQAGIGSADSLFDHEYAMDTLLNNQVAFTETAAAALSRVKKQTMETQVNGHRPDISTIAMRNPGNNDTGEISTRVEVPASVKDKLAGETAIGILNVEQNLQTAQVESETAPSQGVDLVERSGNSTGTVQGASTGSATETAGRVAHAQHAPQGSNLHDPKTPVDLNSPIAPFHHESGAIHALRAIGYGRDRDGCGCPNLTQGMLNDHGRSVLGAIARNL
ncbi:MAG: hypothetical protein WEC84_02525 [Candidatus Andersenbacteria bacterium]